MKRELFYQQFQNTPLMERYKKIIINDKNFNTEYPNGLNMTDIFEELKNLDQEITRGIWRQGELLKIADKLLISKTAKLEK